MGGMVSKIKVFSGSEGRKGKIIKKKKNIYK